MDISKVRLYQRLRAEQSRLGAEADGIKEEADNLEQELVEMFAEEGVPSLVVDGETVHLHRTVYASKSAGVETPDLIAALRAAGLNDLIITDTYSASMLAAYARELEEQGAPLPEPLVGVLTTGDRFSVRIKKKAVESKSAAAIRKG